MPAEGVKRKSRIRHPNADPMRNVVKADLRANSYIFGLPGAKRYVWALHLDCGHEATRGVSYDQRGAERPKRGYAMMWSPPPITQIKPAPKRARCEDCAAEARQAAKEKS